MKYIDADLLRERIGKNQYVIEPMFLKGDDSYYEGEYDSYNRILSIIDSLQQEQQEVDLEKEIERVVENYNSLANGSKVMKPSGIEKIARHFYELGLKARKEE